MLQDQVNLVNDKMEALSAQPITSLTPLNSLLRQIRSTENIVTSIHPSAQRLSL